MGDQGDSCAGGSCNNHVCSPNGDPKIAKIEVTTTSCLDCVDSDEGAVLTITTRTGASCTTLELDNPGPDYAGGSSADFSEELLGGCNKWDSGDAATVGIEWPHAAGTWVPGQVKIFWNTA